MNAPFISTFEWSLADYDAALAMDHEISAVRPLDDGNRVLLDGRPGTITGAGYEPKLGICIDVKMDDGGMRWVQSGSNRIGRIITDDDFHGPQCRQQAAE